jgi:hypothetical protein
VVTTVRWAHMITEEGDGSQPSDPSAGSLTTVRSAEATREISLGRNKRSPDTRSCHRDISHREIGVLKVVRTGTLKVSKSRHNRDHPFGRMHGSDRAPPGEARQEASSENWELEFHESREQLHQTSRNHDTRFPDKAYSVWATQESVEDRWQVKGREPSKDQRIENRKIGIPMDEGSGKSLEETPTRNLNRPFGGTRVRSTEDFGDRDL